MKKGVIIFWSILIIVASVRIIQTWKYVKPDIGQCLKQNVQGLATVAEDPERKESGQILVLSVKEMRAGNSSGNSSVAIDAKANCATDILIRAKTAMYPKFTFGDVVTFSGKLSAPFNFKSEDGYSFDYQGYLAKNDIFYEIKSAKVSKSAISYSDNGLVEGASNNFFDSLNSVLFKIKRGFVNNLEQTLGEPYAALAAGLVVGEKSALGAELLADFRTVGLIHIVVLSGFNITIVADALRRLLNRLPRVWGIIIGGLGMVLFCIMVGGGATVIRSCAMGSLALFANLSRRDYNILRGLSFAALLMLIQNPLILLHDPSFQLSFLATLGLILLATPIEKRLKWIPDKFGMRGTVAATLSTQIFVSPFILYLMGQLSLIGVVVNILVLPFIPLTMLAVFLTGAFGFLSSIITPWFAVISGWCAHILLAYELFMVQAFARVPFAALHIPPFSGWFVAGFYIIFMGVYGYVVWRRKQIRREEE